MIRIVKLHIEPDFITEFEEVFGNIQQKISKFEGCKSVILNKDIHNNEIFFTISEWENEKYLELYRNSVFFEQIWSTIKPHFKNKAEAWSLNQIK
ncbi:MAG: antibiotic biosynthesis monooxygenase [Sphingobacteriaceae bacterium]|nr:antibiotic biosynthesis monooxygenase [Sphingobacteriaceae bacterium]